MMSPFRDDREVSRFQVERLEHENAALRAELEIARRQGQGLPLVSFGFLAGSVTLVLATLAGFFALVQWGASAFSSF